MPCMGRKVGLRVRRAAGGAVLGATLWSDQVTSRLSTKVGNGGKGRSTVSACFIHCVCLVSQIGEQLATAVRQVLIRLD